MSGLGSLLGLAATVYLGKKAIDAKKDIAGQKIKLAEKAIKRDHDTSFGPRRFDSFAGNRHFSYGSDYAFPSYHQPFYSDYGYGGQSYGHAPSYVSYGGHGFDYGYQPQGKHYRFNDGNSYGHSLGRSSYGHSMPGYSHGFSGSYQPAHYAPQALSYHQPATYHMPSYGGGCPHAYA